MKIVMFSINPIFPDVVTGGASKHLFHIAQHLGYQGHQVEILCAQPSRDQCSFTWVDNVIVHPILPFHLPFPQPYAISGVELGLIVTRVAEALTDADRFYVHDGEFLIPDVYDQIPTITSFRDNIYPETVLGTFIGKADDVICVSDYSADIVRYTAGCFYPGLVNRIHMVRNGIDFNVFKAVDPSQMAGELGLNPEVDRIILHPHRPESGKGLAETIKVTAELVHKYGLSRIKVLVPEWIGEMVSETDAGYYNEMGNLMSSLGVKENFQFIPWLSNERMPELYNLGWLTLSLGSIVEAFGNVAYESLACGTPSIVSRVGVHRTLLPDTHIQKVDYGDITTAAEKAAAILSQSKRVSQETLSYLHENFDFNWQVQTYADIITNCQKQDTLKFSSPNNRKDRIHVLAPWCYLDGDRIFHDFRGQFEQVDGLSELLKISDTLSLADAQAVGITEETWQRWLDYTWIVPVPCY